MIEFLFLVLILFIIIIVTGYALGVFIASSFDPDERISATKIEKIFNKIETVIFKFCNINPAESMKGRKYFFILLASNIIISAVSFIMLYFQDHLPYQGNVHSKLELSLIFHILSSLITNTCQTHHLPEQDITPLSNYFVFILLMFYSSASGIATGIATIRGITKGTLGNAYVDIIKAHTRVLLPFSLLFSLIFCLLGMPNTFTSFIDFKTLENISDRLILGPVAAFEAIKLFGENGLSCFNANSAHPFENPSYLTNLIHLISITIVPIALIFTLGFWLKNLKQAVIIIFVLLAVLAFEYSFVTYKELQGNKTINTILNKNEPNWIGKETRFGIVASSIYQASVSNVSGASNASLDSFHPIINLFGLFNLANQSVFGVQGFGLIFTVSFILYTTFYIGLMLGKAPELFGKKIEKNEIIINSILLLINPILVFSGIALTLIVFPEKTTSFYDNVHHFTRIFYEFVSGAASNGSGLEGLKDNTTYWNTALGITMLVARYGAMASMLALGSSFAKKPVLSVTKSTFKTDTALFGIIFLVMSVVSTLLTYFPFFTLGPITEIFSSK